jgi:RNA recognition motif-containing protein
VNIVSYTSSDASIATTTNELRDLFAEHGEVVYVSLPLHKESGKARGFAFVDMITKEACDVAIKALNGFEVGGRMIRVVESLPQDKAKAEPKKIGMYKFFCYPASNLHVWGRHSFVISCVLYL